MKKYLFLMMVTAVAMTACTNESEEYVGSQEVLEISISPLTQNATRAAVDGTTFPTTEDMQVAAYDVTNSRNFFAGTTFKYNYAAGASGSSSGYWGGSTARYWPLSPANINFLAYANVTGTAAFNGTNYASAAVISQTDNSSAQEDLMYAIGNGAVTQSGNALTFPEKVDMTFKHAQAWISFTAVSSEAASGKITLNKITLNGAKYAGTYTITHTNYNASSSQSVAGAWSSLASAKNVDVPGWTAAAVTKTAANVGNGLMIVPDDTDTGDFTSFTVNYTLDGNTYNYTYTPASVNVEQGKHYIYAITFSLNEIFINPAVTDWVDQTAVDVAIP